MLGFNACAHSARLFVGPPVTFSRPHLPVYLSPLCVWWRMPTTLLHTTLCTPPK